jgi:type I restriction enzyme S subunit
MVNRFSTYKDSGLVSIEEVPSHWKKNRIKYIGFMYGGLTGKSGDDFRMDEDDPSNKPFIPFTNICNNTYIKGSDLKLVSINEDDNQNKVEKDDLFFMMTSETQEDVGKTSVLKEDLGEVYLNTFCKGFRITDRSVNPYFLNYLLNGKPYRELLSVEGNGFTRINLRQDRVNDFVLFTPPITEQEQIVKYLDEKTSQIDQLISITEKKIEGLKEKRTSLINHVVTKGLDSNIEMKDSGVEWIGEIPKHWEVKRIKNITENHRQGYYSSREYDESGHRMVRITDINDDNSISIVNSPFYDLEEVEVERFKLENGDFLFPRTGGVGRFGIFEGQEQSIYGSFLIRFRFSDDIRHSFIKYFLNTQSYLNQILQVIHGGVNQNVHVENIKECKICFPSDPKEQNEIIDYLDNHTKEIDNLISLEQQRIETLKEYRQSLISEVVTGKIRVF